MKKRNLFASCLLLSSLIAGCSCNANKVDTHASVSYENETISTNKGDSITVGEIYDYMLANQQDVVSKTILTKILEKQIDFTNTDILNLYKRYLNEYFTTTFVENDSYKYNGDFSEELLVNYLKSESYIVKCGTGISSGVLDNSKFSCDFSDYIEKEVNYDIYMKILKVQYIINEKTNLIDKNSARKISYYSVSKGSTDNETREKLEEYVARIAENYNSEDDTLIRSIEDVAEAKRKEELDVIADDFAKVSTSSDSSAGYTYLNKFTTCANRRCSLEEGKAYQESLIMEKEYYVTKVVVKENSDILYEDARKLLFSDNINDYLYKIGDKNYLMSPAYAQINDQRINDIILFDSSNTYYLVTVDVINSQSSFEDKISVAEILVNKISDSTILDYCFEDLDIEMFDKNIREYFENKYGEIEDK